MCIKLCILFNKKWSKLHIKQITDRLVCYLKNLERYFEQKLNFSTI